MAEAVSASTLSIRLEEPISPTNDSEFKINFVTLNTENKAVTVKCFKKGPTEADFSQFGSDIALTSGGNTGNCGVNSAIINSVGTYQFYTTAQTDADSATSSTVTVDYKSGAPGTPGNYSKEEISDCEYKINFKTAQDNGQTSRVEIYMSTLTSFPADSGTRVGEVGIGSDQAGSFRKVVSECDKTYYFAIRAFDQAGNGSAVVGDTTTIVTETLVTESATTSVQTQSAPVAEAIPVDQSQVAPAEIPAESVPGGEEQTTISEEVLGEVTNSAQLSEGKVEISETENPFKNYLWLVVASQAFAGIFVFRKLKENNFHLW